MLQALANLAWSMAHLNYKHEGLLDAIVNQLLRNVDDLNQRDLADVLSALAMLKHQPITQATDAIVHHMIHLLQEPGTLLASQPSAASHRKLQLCSLLDCTCSEVATCIKAIKQSACQASATSAVLSMCRQLSLALITELHIIPCSASEARCSQPNVQELLLMLHPQAPLGYSKTCRQYAGPWPNSTLATANCWISSTTASWWTSRC